MYLVWDEKKITDSSDLNINSLYNQGYLFTRKGKGVINQTRSIRVDLDRFTLTSENRRILKKTEDIGLKTYDLPLEQYHWSIGKMAKDFYDTKFGVGTFSANKVKELLTDREKSNFNRLLAYTVTNVVIPAKAGIHRVRFLDPHFRGDDKTKSGNDKTDVGWAICLETNELLHYSYPFYIIHNSKFIIQNLGLGMMLKAIIHAKDSGKKYVYLGSAQRPTDTYKLQFEGLEWFDGKVWRRKMEELKQILQNTLSDLM